MRASAGHYVLDIPGQHDPRLRWQFLGQRFDCRQSDPNRSLQGSGWPNVTNLETYRTLYAVGLAQDLKRTGDIEQQQAWWDYDEHRDRPNFIRTRRRVRTADKSFVITTQHSGFSRWP